MIQRLKEETRELHEQVEEENLAKYIMDHSMDLPTYKLLLVQNYIAYTATEKAIKRIIPGYSGSKHEQLRKDLVQLGVSLEIPAKNDSFVCHSIAEALGAAYVVEGSALGGMVLARNISKCPGLSSVEQHHFFNGEKANVQEWNAFKDRLKQHNFSPVEEEQAIEKAQDTFRFFKAVFRSHFVLS